MVPTETKGHEKILRLLSDWKKSAWGRRAQSHRTGLVIWELEGWRVLAQPLFTVKVSTVEEGSELHYCHKPCI